MKESSALFMLSAGLATAAVVVYRRRLSRVGVWHRAAGVVVEVKDSNDGEALTTPVVKFRPKEREADVIFARSVYTNILRYKVGERVEVLYDPSDPSTASIASIPELYLLPLFVAAVALCVALAGVIISYTKLA